MVAARKPPRMACCCACNDILNYDGVSLRWSVSCDVPGCTNWTCALCGGFGSEDEATWRAAKQAGRPFVFACCAHGDKNDKRRQTTAFARSHKQKSHTRPLECVKPEPIGTASRKRTINAVTSDAEFAKELQARDLKAIFDALPNPPAPPPPALPRATRAAATRPALRGMALLRERLRLKGHTMKDVVGDGACQFRALAHQLCGDEAQHATIRESVVAYLRAHPPLVWEPSVFVSLQNGPRDAVELPVSSLREYLDLMLQPTTWGDMVTLQACADAFQTTVRLVTTWADHGKEEWYRLIQPRSGSTTSGDSICIGFNAELHYTSTVI